MPDEEGRAGMKFAYMSFSTPSLSMAEMLATLRGYERELKGA